MVTSLRKDLSATGLKNGKGCSNAGLALDRYLSEIIHKDENENLTELFNNTTCAYAYTSDIYKSAYKRWEKYLSGENIKYDKFQTLDRIIVGLGAESVSEVSITLNRTYGVPVIPGSAIKGMTRHYFVREFAKAKQEKELSNEHRKQLELIFGSTDSAGFVTFYDAWYVPDSTDGSPLKADIMTPHHQQYNSTKGANAPTDFDDPTPVPFISACGQYLIAIKGPNAEWTNFVFALVKTALAEYGVGGKTSSGYGRLVPADTYTPPSGSQPRPSIEKSKSQNKGLSKPVSPPKPVEKSSKKEWVTIINTIKGGKATVRTETGEEITCNGMPPFGNSDRCRAEVERENNKAVSAKFKGWN